MTTEEAALCKAIRGNPEKAAAALDAIQRGRPQALSYDGVKAAAQFSGKADVEPYLIELLRGGGDLKLFAAALEARGVALGLPAPPDLKAAKDEAEKFFQREGFNVPNNVLVKFIPRSKRAACRIRVEGKFAGTGLLIGPSLVLTAWHVVKDLPDGRARKLEVDLLNETSCEGLPRLIYQSPATELELKSDFVDNDAADKFNNLNDIAVFRLARPEGVRAGYDGLQNSLAKFDPAPVLLFHFPDGRDPGVGFAMLTPNPNLTARWTYDAPTSPGSSGGACFDFQGNFVGVHNARGGTSRRLVPAPRFLPAIRALIDADIAPLYLYKLDDEVILGRDQFFEAVSTASKKTSRIRGLRIKRIHSEAQGRRGLSFSKQMLEKLLERNPGAHKIIGLNFDRTFKDLLEEIERLSGAPGASTAEASAGLRSGETTAQATMKSRAQALAARLDEFAGREGEGQLWWFFFENATRSLSADEAMALEQFVAAAILQPRLRVILAGFELIVTPGPELAGVAAGEDGAPGFAVELFGQAERRDIEHVLALAAIDSGRELEPCELKVRTNDILFAAGPGAGVNGRFGPAAIEKIKRAIEADLPRIQGAPE